MWGGLCENLGRFGKLGLGITGRGGKAKRKREKFVNTSYLPKVTGWREPLMTRNGRGTAGGVCSFSFPRKGEAQRKFSLQKSISLKSFFPLGLHFLLNYVVSSKNLIAIF